MRKKRFSALAVALVLGAWGCGNNGDTDAGSVAADAGPAPVYVTVAGHIEDSLAYTDCDNYRQKRAQLLEFADAIEGAGVAFNLQVSYEWLLGSSRCETDPLKSTTDGLGVLDYLEQRHGFEIDVHQEGASIRDTSSGNNFADIRYMGGQVTDSMSETTGFQWDNPMQYRSLQGGERGLLHPEFTWLPEILAGGVSVDHTRGDFSRDMTSVGVWIPSGFSEAEFHVHDTSDDARMVYVGSGPNQFSADWGDRGACHFQNTADFVEVLVGYIDTGRVASEMIYTTTLFVPQSVIFSPDRYAELLTTLDQMTPLVDTGQVQYAHFTEVVEVWRRDHGAEPSILRYDAIDPADYTCE